MIDLHSHLLPGVDDGARDLDEAVRTLEALVDVGYTAIVLTPHLRASDMPAGLPLAFDAAYEALVPEKPLELTLHRGVELWLDVPLPKLEAPERFTLAGSRYLLVEFPPAIDAGRGADLLARVVRRRLRPIVAHPERYRVCTPGVVRRWRAAGAAIQVDATTLTMPGTRGDRARDLLAHGLADVLAADNHGDVRTLATAVHYLARFDADHVARRLCTDNPRAVVEDRNLELVPPVPLPLVERVRKWVEGRGEGRRGGAGTQGKGEEGRGRGRGRMGPFPLPPSPFPGGGGEVGE